MKTLAQNVLAYIRKHSLLSPGDRTGLAVSGGADSVAMLRLLLDLRAEIGIVLSVVHFNHKLRGSESEGDESLVRRLAEDHKLPFFCESGDVASHAADKRLSLETAAREMRYRYFHRLFVDDKLNRIATGHTLDDQAETVLLRLVRGAGTRGLAGIYPELNIQDSVTGAPIPNIVRPLLNTRRNDLESYLVSIGQTWREDSSNRDLRHARNRVRHGILPRMERSLNPAVREALAEAAEIARVEEDYWEHKVAEILPSVSEILREHAVVRVPALRELPLALQRRVLRRVAEGIGLRLEFRQVENILEIAASECGHAKSEMLGDDWIASRHKEELRFERDDEARKPSDYEYRLPVPGSVTVPELQSRFEAVLVSGTACEGYNPEQSIRREALGIETRIRNWRAGDRFWPAHTKAPKKIKELLYERHLEGPERRLWPVVVCGEEVVWMRGFPPPANLKPRSKAEAVVIRESPFSGKV